MIRPSGTVRGERRAARGLLGLGAQGLAGIVYRHDLPQRRWFEHSAAPLDTVAINNTFYLA